MYKKKLSTSVRMPRTVRQSSACDVMPNIYIKRIPQT